jgi:hypothetical protein
MTKVQVSLQEIVVIELWFSARDMAAAGEIPGSVVSMMTVKELVEAIAAPAPNDARAENVYVPADKPESAQL